MIMTLLGVTLLALVVATVVFVLLIMCMIAMTRFVARVGGLHRRDPTVIDRSV
jgi:hypothetical protein